MTNHRLTVDICQLKNSFLEEKQIVVDLRKTLAEKLQIHQKEVDGFE